jgi:hypothetical protein
MRGSELSAKSPEDEAGILLAQNFPTKGVRAMMISNCEPKLPLAGISKGN